MKEILLALWLAAQSYGVSYELLYALARVESGLRPYAVNVEGVPHYPESREEALSLIRDKRNYDAGLMQINSYWVRRLNINPEWLFDLEYNAKMGALVLRYCQNLFGNTWKSVECYHRGEAQAQEIGEYSLKVCFVLYGSNCLDDGKKQSYSKKYTSGG